MICLMAQNVIQRSSLESSVTIPDRPGIKEMISDVIEAVAKNGRLDPYPPNSTRLCGWPNSLLLPRGTKEGMKFKMFVIITSTARGDYDEDEYPSLPYCGTPSGNNPDGLPMGFPFNRKISEKTSFIWGIHDNYMFMDVIVKHRGKK